MRVFNVRCTEEQASGLTALVDAHREAEDDWRTKRRKEIRGLRLPAAERARRLAAVRVEFQRLRDVGEFRGTRSAMVLPALRELLAERGWATRRWRPIPPEALRHGRPWGTHDRNWKGRVTLYLPDDLAERVNRACFWVSAPAVARLQEWYDVHGDHWRGQLNNPKPWHGAGASPSDLAERASLAAEIHTTGRLMREAIDRVLSEAEVR